MTLLVVQAVERFVEKATRRWERRLPPPEEVTERRPIPRDTVRALVRLQLVLDVLAFAALLAAVLAGWTPVATRLLIFWIPLRILTWLGIWMTLLRKAAP